MLPELEIREGLNKLNWKSREIIKKTVYLPVTRMHSIKIRTARSLTVCHSCSIYPGGGHAWWGACMVGGMHGRGACVAGGHAWRGCAWQRGTHDPPPYMPPAMHTHCHACPLPCMPPLPHMPSCHTCPLITHAPLATHPPCHTHPPAMHTPPGQNHRRLWKYNLAPSSLRAVISLFLLRLICIALWRFLRSNIYLFMLKM